MNVEEGFASPVPNGKYLTFNVFFASFACAESDKGGFPTCRESDEGAESRRGGGRDDPAMRWTLRRLDPRSALPRTVTLSPLRNRTTTSAMPQVGSP